MQTAGRSACLILHGKAASREDVRAAVRAMRDEGHCLDVRVTWEAGDSTRFAREASTTGVGVVIAGGGDGTVNEVTAGLISAAGDSRPTAALAVLPLGTANDLARSCRVPLDPFEALQLAMTAAPAMVDVGQANGRAFMNVATGGFGTQVTVATPNDLKKVLGGAAYFVTGLTHFSSIRPAQGRISWPDGSWDGAFLVLALGNGRQAGGGHQLCPEAMLDDGLIDVRVLPQLPNEDVPGALRTLLRDGLDAVRRTVVSARAAWVEIATDEPMQINLDGEPITDTRFRFELLPGRLRMMLPGDCPLLARPAAAAI